MTRRWLDRLIDARVRCMAHLAAPRLAADAHMHTRTRAGRARRWSWTAHQRCCAGVSNMPSKQHRRHSISCWRRWAGRLTRGLRRPGARPPALLAPALRTDVVRCSHLGQCAGLVTLLRATSAVVAQGRPAADVRLPQELLDKVSRRSPRCSLPGRCSHSHHDAPFSMACEQAIFPARPSSWPQWCTTLPAWRTCTCSTLAPCWPMRACRAASSERCCLLLPATCTWIAYDVQTLTCSTHCLGSRSRRRCSGGW